MLLKDWREEKGYSLAQAAELFGLRGVNPAETWRRWEIGAYRPPDADVVAAIQSFTRGAVTPADWHAVRIAFIGDRDHGDPSSLPAQSGDDANHGASLPQSHVNPAPVGLQARRLLRAAGAGR